MDADIAPIRVMIVDDHAVVRDGLNALLGTRADLQVVGLASDGLQAVTTAHACHPEVVLMDLGMPRMDGVEATRRLLAMTPAPQVIALTMSDAENSVLAAVRAGARGYLLKDADGDEVIAAIHAVMSGHAVFGPGVATAVLDLLHNPPVKTAPPFPQLTNREREVLDLLSAGLGNQAISRRLTISPKTVANCVSAIITKLQTTDRAHAALIARAAGFGATR